MSKVYIPKALRARVAKQAKYRCGYCLTQLKYVGFGFEVDHIIPTSKGGLTTEENLWYACTSCNDSKNKRTTAIDLLTNEEVNLFNPRLQIWSEHFTWDEAKTIISGKTAIGRATVKALNLNLPDMVIAREAWVLVDWHPPKE